MPAGLAYESSAQIHQYPKAPRRPRAQQCAHQLLALTRILCGGAPQNRPKARWEVYLVFLMRPNDVVRRRRSAAVSDALFYIVA